MPRVVFERTCFEVDAPDGARIVDLSYAHPQAAVPYSCRRASCGTCRVEVREGLELCVPPSEAEREVLEIFHDPPSVRLACQLCVRPGGGVVRLRVLV